MLRVFIFLLPFLISGCFMGPVQLPEIHKYQLTACMPMFFVPAKSNKTLLVSMPKAIYPYDSTHMVYSQRRNEISYFAENRWISSPKQMMLPLILQAIRNAHYFKSVVGAPAFVSVDYQLDTTLLMFKQEFCGEKSQVHVVLDAVLIASATKSVLATRRIDVCVPTACLTPTSGVLAYQCALNKVLTQLVQWVVMRSSYE